MTISADQIQALQRFVQLAKQAAFNPDDLCFPKQRRLVRDRALRKAVCAGRGSGKSRGAVVAMLDHALRHIKHRIIYATKTVEWGRKIVWGDLVAFVQEFKLPATVSESDSEIRFSNGSVIEICGLNNAQEAAKLRGRTIDFLIFDEAQELYRVIADAIESHAGPRLTSKSPVWVMGTPSVAMTGYWYDLQRDPSWKKFHWDASDATPEMRADFRKKLRKELKRRGVEESDPSIQREYFGRWVQPSEDEVCFPWDPVKNGLDAIPKCDHYVAGVDFGHSPDCDAVAVLGWDDDDPERHIYLCWDYKARFGTTDTMGKTLDEVVNRFNPDAMVGDTGGGGTREAANLQNAYDHVLQPAEKQNKAQSIRQFRDAVTSGRFRAHADSEWCDEATQTTFNETHTNWSDAYHPDVLDAALYAYRKAIALGYQPREAEEPPKPKDAEQARMRRQHMRAIKKPPEAREAAALGLATEFDDDSDGSDRSFDSIDW